MACQRGDGIKTKQNKNSPLKYFQVSTNTSPVIVPLLIHPIDVALREGGKPS